VYGVEQDYPVTLQLSNASAKAILKTILELVSPEDPKEQITYVIDDGILKISTAARLQRMVPRAATNQQLKHEIRLLEIEKTKAAIAQLAKRVLGSDSGRTREAALKERDQLQKQLEVQIKEIRNIVVNKSYREDVNTERMRETERQMKQKKGQTRGTNKLEQIRNNRNMFYLMPDGHMKLMALAKTEPEADASKQQLEEASLLSRRKQYHQALVIVNEVLDRTPDHDPDHFAARMMRNTIFPHARVQQIRDAEIARKLDKVVDVDFKNTPFVDVIEHLIKQTELNIYVDWAAVKDVGVKMDTPVTLTMKQVKVTDSLGLIMTEVSRGNELDPISYAVDKGIVKISIRHQLRREMVGSKIYDINDIIKARVKNITDKEARKLFMSKLLNLVRSHGRPEEWTEFGGDVSSVSELNGYLIVRTYPDIHGEILATLGQLRKHGLRAVLTPQHRWGWHGHVIRTYDIRDLLEPVRQFELDEEGQPLEFNNEKQLRERFLKQMLHLVREIGNPEHWSANGGHVSSVKELNGSLVVEASPNIHREYPRCSLSFA
jgi:hypothetical protein